MDAGKFRAAESSRESDQDKCGVPNAEQILTPGSDDPAGVCREERGLSVLRGAYGAADALEGFTDDKVAGRGRRVGEVSMNCLSEQGSETFGSTICATRLLPGT